MVEKKVEKKNDELSPFKKRLREDIDIFLNPKEFGEKITINDVEYTAVIEHPEKDFSIVEDGIAEAIAIILYLEEKDEFKKYKTGKSITVNSSQYIINDSYEEEGMRVIKLSENRGY